MCGDIIGYHIPRGRGLAGVQWVETRDAAKLPAMQRTAPPQRTVQPQE